ncbi:fibronectin type III domain-containing protein [Trujillonella endophytica]|uniref:Ig-like domain (Group 3) n=1 Tax=Trujillonella endophytica TaxID=673521 RepID=A0A1H8W3Y8_9ACTN|nr:fibronectin type III domain-containing protein [Trujillella endophytica]SEP22349.1 Ig-like domain (group 3) [Trujillella endophytica]
MHLAPSSRRALGLAAVGAIALSTTLVSLSGVASATPLPGGPSELRFSTDAASVAEDGYSLIDGAFTVPSGYCQMSWTVRGAAGGSGYYGAGLPGEVVQGDTAAAPGVYAVTVGTAGGPGAFSVGGVAGTGSAPAAAAGGVLMMPMPGGMPGMFIPMPAGAGGGGGGGSAVTGPGGFAVQAPGGAGGGPLQGIGGGALALPDGLSAGVPGPTGAGLVEVVVSPCAPVLAAPSAPQGLAVEAGRSGALDLSFLPGAFDADAQSPVTGYEVTTDGGATHDPLPTSAEQGARIGALAALANGTAYDVQVRATSAVGPSAWSDEVTATPYLAIGAPVNVRATAGPSSIVLTWDAPTSPGTYGLAGYVVGGEATSADGTDGASGIACETTPDVRTCVLVATPGWSHTFGVTPVDAEGNPGAHSAVVTVSDVPRSSVPAGVPARSGDLVRPAGQTGSVAVGSPVTFSGSGYLPGSTVTLLVYSEPQVLTTVVADASGSFTVTVTVPAGLVAGQHTLVASGVDLTGALRYLTLPITVAGGTTGSGGLAYTGAAVAVPAMAGLAALALGGGLVLAGRRRRTAE